MSKILFTVKTEAKAVPVEYLQMMKMKRCGKAFASKKEYVRNPKHRKSWLEV